MPPVTTVTDEVQLLPLINSSPVLNTQEHLLLAVRSLLRTVCPPHCQWCTTGGVPRTLVEFHSSPPNNHWCSYSRSSPSSPCALVLNSRERLLLTVCGLLHTLSLLTCRVPGCICNHIHRSLLLTSESPNHQHSPLLWYTMGSVFLTSPCSRPGCPFKFTNNDHHRSSPPAGV